MVQELSIPPSGSKDLYFATQYSQSTWGQFKSCLWKQWWSYWRSPDYNLVRYFFTLACALMVGTIFWKIGKKRFLSFSSFYFVHFIPFDPDLFTLFYHFFYSDRIFRKKNKNAVTFFDMENFYDIFLYIWKSQRLFIYLKSWLCIYKLILFFWIFRDSSSDLTTIIGAMYAAVLFVGINNCSTVQPIVATERTVFYRETAAGMYSALPYAMAQVKKTKNKKKYHHTVHFYIFLLINYIKLMKCRCLWRYRMYLFKQHITLS